MKLLLDRKALAETYGDGIYSTSVTGALALPEGKTAEKVVTDFLAKLYSHTIAKLSEAIRVELFQRTPIEFWFTMPAMWSDEAQAATRRAAKNAGFSSRPIDGIKMICEPEAAAIAALKYQNNELEGSVKLDERILICDCGGGTVVSG
jgi:molecular chaperone DnaK (HSP70)